MVVKCFEDKMTVKCKQLSRGRKGGYLWPGAGEVLERDTWAEAWRRQKVVLGDGEVMGEDRKYQGLGGASVVSLGEARIVRWGQRHKGPASTGTERAWLQPPSESFKQESDKVWPRFLEGPLGCCGRMDRRRTRTEQRDQLESDLARDSGASQWIETERWPDVGCGNRFERDYFIENKCFKNGLYNWEVSKLLNKLFSQSTWTHN